MLFLQVTASTKPLNIRHADIIIYIIICTLIYNYMYYIILGNNVLISKT
jgi:hypothetical protein